MPKDGKERWQIRQGLARLNLNGAECAVMMCLIECGAPFAYPSERFIIGFTGRPLRSVQRAISSLQKRGLMHVSARRGMCNEYYIDTGKLLDAYKDIQAFKTKWKQQRPEQAESEGADDRPGWDNSSERVCDTVSTVQCAPEVARG